MKCGRIEVNVGENTDSLACETDENYISAGHAFKKRQTAQNKPFRYLYILTRFKNRHLTVPAVNVTLLNG